MRIFRLDPTGVDVVEAISAAFSFSDGQENYFVLGVNAIVRACRRHISDIR